MAGNTNLELEIHSLFMEGSSPEHICSEIISKYEKNEVLSASELESISHFLITVGRFDLLNKFYLSALQRNAFNVFPWGYFATSVLEQLGYIPEEIVDMIDLAIKNQRIDASSCKVPDLQDLLPQLATQEIASRQQFEIEQLQLKTKLISQLNQNRLYQLHEQEEQTLKQLVKYFPQDVEVRLLHQAHLEKKADEILARVRANKKPMPYQGVRDKTTSETQEFIEKLTGQVQKLADLYQVDAPDQIYNLALFCMSFELYDLSIEILKKAPETLAGEWLKAEILFENGRYLDLLKQIEHLEKTMTTTPDSTYGAIYLKAQAYYGLGQKEIAISLLESLAQARPSFRSTEALLHQWRTF